MAIDDGEALARLRRLSEVCDLRSERRLGTKVDMSAGAVTFRLRRVSELRDVGRRLAALGAAAGLSVSEIDSP